MPHLLQVLQQSVGILRLQAQRRVYIKMEVGRIPLRGKNLLPIVKQLRIQQKIPLHKRREILEIDEILQQLDVPVRIHAHHRRLVIGRDPYFVGDVRQHAILLFQIVCCQLHAGLHRLFLIIFEAIRRILQQHE